MDSALDEIIAIYCQRWEIELMFKQMKQNFSAEILLWRKRKRHQNTDMGDSDCQSAADGHAEGAETAMEFLGAGDKGQDYPDVLR